MGTLIILAILALVVLGFNNPLWWFAGAALLYLHFRYGRTGQGPSGSSSPRGAGSSARGDNDYRAYRQRRDQQARWERRYRRERPWMTRQKRN
ncbi:hypothetical protein QF035_007451 [Streptomyces umbrinus]|uniref:Uncharacterized protein n=1 Tax=Streptomyces umbrinus TaxID=67370 RepID=A0ABU0T226_9ACTN|nr:hypothetical protein [Streptomyces umbrinus]MDQ1029869.1 hypothetical protein [Streptomyces umbrinus]